jgi:hypothetical protein
MNGKKTSKVKRLKEILKNRKKILEGIKNYLWNNHDVEVIAAHRNSICMTCDKIDIKGDSCLAPGSQPCCSSCGCSLQFKTRSLSSACPHSKWDAVMTEEEEEEYFKNAKVQD